VTVTVKILHFYPRVTVSKTDKGICKYKSLLRCKRCNLFTDFCHL